MTTAQRRLTLEQFLNLPETKPAREYENGHVRRKVSPKGRHSTLQFAAAAMINSFAVPRKLARAFPELRATFAGNSYVPDVAVYRWDRIPRTSVGEVEDDFYDPPDVAIEVASPGQSLDLLVERCLWYVDHGVRMALLINPRTKTVMRFRHGSTPATLRDSDWVEFDEVLPEFRFSVNELFSSLLL